MEEIEEGVAGAEIQGEVGLELPLVFGVGVDGGFAQAVCGQGQGIAS